MKVFRNKIGLAASVLGGFLMLGMSSSVYARCGLDSTAVGIPAVSTSFRVNGLSMSNSDFSISLMNNILKEVKKGNIVISPFFVEMSLSLMYNGADGKTKDQIAKVLGQTHETMDQYNSENALVYDFIDKINPKYKFNHHSAFWVKDSLKVKSDFVELGKNAFGTNITPINFVRKDIAQELDTQFEKASGGTFPKILKTVSMQSKMVLVNAQFFKGFWKKRFKLMGSVEFTLASGKTKPQMMMFQNGSFEYFQDDYLQAVRIPYDGTDLVMEAYVPKAKDGIKLMETKLNKATLQTWRDAFKPRKGTVVLPLFNMSAKIHLMGPLTGLGLNSAFNPATANFSKMTEGSQAAVSKYTSGVILSVHEDGTPVSPKAEVEEAKIPQLPNSFHILADHPFFFIIRKTTEDKILFMGIVLSPKDVIKEKDGGQSGNDD